MKFGRGISPSRALLRGDIESLVRSLRPSYVFVVAAAVSITAMFMGCASDEPAAETAGPAAVGDESELINGTVAADDDYRPTILIQNTCTAVKVGPQKILTAAHCVDGQGGSELFDGGPLVFFTANAVTDDTAYDLAERATIETVRIHPSYDRLHHLSDQPDVAVITLAPGSTFDDIPSAVVDIDPIPVGTKLVLNGYGCPAIQPGGGNGDHVLRFGTAKSVSIKTLGIGFDAERLSLIDQNFVVTAGSGLREGATSVCPGDSGGPVYRSGTAKLTVAGINSWIAGISQAGPKASMMARLHEGSRHAVGEWLSQQGVQLTRACKNAERCEGPIEDPRALPTP
jgi:hypothetical protein